MYQFEQEMRDVTSEDIENSESCATHKNNAAYQRKYRKNNPDKYYETRRKYRHENSKWDTDAHYLSRPFTAWDGEGITEDSGKHLYTLLAVKNRSDSDSIVDVEGLSTLDIFKFVLDFAEISKNSIHVIYGGSYDFNMWMRDIPHNVLNKIYEMPFVQWMNYRIGWRRGKSFYLAEMRGNKRVRQITIYDCAPFFQVKFVKACDDYLGADFYRRDIVVKNKELRSSFTLADAAEVAEYNDIELENLIRLMEELRRRLNAVGLRPKRWDGPGAIASALLSREGVKEKRAECPAPVQEAAQYAYAGGRFEVIRFGSVLDKAYEYDVNSAYPAALRFVPNLARGTWVQHFEDIGDKPFALYKVRWGMPHGGEFYRNRYLPGPLFMRNTNGTISYPTRGANWVWSPEVATLREYVKRVPGAWFEITEVWEFVEDDATDKPFAFIEPLYRERKRLKADGDGAHVGIKLGLNSLYGKLAQQVGARELPNGTWRIPPFHQLEWAGYTTSYCRARVLGACLDNLSDVIAFETDAVFTMAELDVPISEDLGDFEREEFTRLTYCQSGVYFANGVTKSRGFEALEEKAAIRRMFRFKQSERVLTVKTTRFVGMGVARVQGWEKWQRWETTGRVLRLHPVGKRMPDPLNLEGDYQLERNIWYHTIAMQGRHGPFSERFPLAWVEGSEPMPKLEEFRNSPVAWQDDF